MLPSKRSPGFGWVSPSRTELKAGLQHPIENPASPIAYVTNSRGRRSVPSEQRATELGHTTQEWKRGSTDVILGSLLSVSFYGSCSFALDRKAICKQEEWAAIEKTSRGKKKESEKTLLAQAIGGKIPFRYNQLSCVLHYIAPWAEHFLSLCEDWG